MTRDAETALTALYERLVERRSAAVEPRQETVARERALVRAASAAAARAYRAALSRAHATLAVARGAIADRLRREAIQERLPVGCPVGG